ncbi:hypothetical protein RHMOL_Rhmol11G0076000 [Rhododendron molle]|uniref:Uncharacterized protein n=1 Tax=Rhododendron molle TaxID=49168 RepID=A0ACC0LQL5_RHOML|nr:hypothetical protein RHMOL_Rhmol11G0076000 [Rhododendron molle]
MDIKLPFVRGFPKQNRRTDGSARTVYYIANFTGDLEEVASSLLVDETTIVYEACADFREKYGHIFPIGSIKVWDSDEPMLAWADKMIWFSFLITSHKSWPDFWDDNKLRSGFKLVFGCERSWTFDVVVLMTNLEPVYFDWSTTTHEFQESSLMPFVIDDLGTPRDLRTSCFPSMMSTKQNIMQFGYDCGSGKCIFKVFGK